MKKKRKIPPPHPQGRFQRVVCGIDVRRSLGFNDPENWTAFYHMIFKWEDGNRVDLAKLLASKFGPKPRTMLHQWEETGRTTRMSEDTMLVVLDEVEPWLQKRLKQHLAQKKRGKKRDRTVGYCPQSVKVNRHYFAALLDGYETLTVDELPGRLRAYRDECVGSTKFNRTRSACQAFVRDNVTGPGGGDGEFSEIGLALKGIKSRKENREDGTPLEPWQMFDAVARLNEIKRGLGAVFQTSCETGMTWKEYTVDVWEVLPDRVLIHGDKNEFRDRVIFRIGMPVERPRGLGYQTYLDAVKAVGQAMGLPALQPRDGRRTLSHLMDMAGIPGSRRDRYMGHSKHKRGMRGVYDDHPVEWYLGQDRDAVLRYVSEHAQAPNQSPEQAAVEALLAEVSRGK